MGLGLTPDDVSALEARTEGWIAALQLAALSVRGRDDAAGFIAGFAGDDRYVVDYLVEEVLQRQPERVRRFLLETAVLDRMTGPLCDAVTSLDGGRATLEALERANLFLIPLDDRRRWYRYHHLFADVLRARLQVAAAGAEIAELHRRASDWFAAHDQPTEAIEHALAASDFLRAAALIEENWTQGLAAGLHHLPTVERWLAVLPLALVRSSPALCFFRAAPLVGLSGIDLAGAETWLTAGERALAAGGPRATRRRRTSRASSPGRGHCSRPRAATRMVH
jgi:LuxR family maltose regulon positive regulatory protein